ncbi:MAG TPA: DUF2905 domain-containing protein [Candidatus Manganitrophaceae bacterium]|nr:DUF2905 domain-containing protein [Candidatus Manganitrophaceae bacterium]
MLDLGRTLIFLGVLLVLIGGLVLLAGKIPGLGKLPGDIIIQRKNFTFYFPLATGLLISAVLSLLFWLLSKR